MKVGESCLPPTVINTGGADVRMPYSDKEERVAGGIAGYDALWCQLPRRWRESQAYPGEGQSSGFLEGSGESGFNLSTQRGTLSETTLGTAAVGGGMKATAGVSGRGTRSAVATPIAAHSRGGELAAEPKPKRLAADLPSVDSEKHCSGLRASNPSYTQALSLAA